jgi:hypothetical protein
VGAQDSNDRYLRVLRAHGVSSCEDAVLLMVHYHITLPPRGIAESAKSYDEEAGNPLGRFPLEDYLRAADGCVARGWLTVLTAGHFEREARRRLIGGVPEVIDICYRPGHLAFTEAGFHFYQALLHELDPARPPEEYWGWNWDAERRTFDLFAEDADRCRALLAELEQDLAWYVGGPARVVGVAGPYPIGPWKPDRFTTVPRGFHLAAQVDLLAEGGEPSGPP